MADQEHEVVFKKETIKKLLTLFLRDPRNKVSGDTVGLMAEMLRVFVVEAARRAIKQADSEDCVRVNVEHVEKILPQLLLDF